MNPYEVLGVPPTATAEEVKAAYRTRAQATHPDKPGGSEEEFKAVGAAFTLLSDPDARKAYDEFGDTGGGLTVAQEAEQVLAATFAQFLAQDIPEPPLTSMREALKPAVSEQKRELNKAKRTQAKAAKLLKALRRKVPGPNTLTDVLLLQQKTAEQNITQLARRLAVLAQVQLSLDQWEDSSPLTKPAKEDQGGPAEDMNRLFRQFFYNAED